MLNLEKARAKKVEKSDFLDLSEMGTEWVRNEIEKGRKDAKMGRVTPLPKTLDGFFMELGVENIPRRAYR
ncbi:hypothetical protein IJ103_00635 [Candidatus Saccharibacteria bacterium]|nr:hypothetical protein [Candidatus Saccharibacteria bacterium]